MNRSVERKLLGTAAGAAIYLGTLLTPATVNAKGEGAPVHPGRAARVKIGGHAVKSVAPEVDPLLRENNRGASSNGGTTAEHLPTGCTSSAGTVITNGSPARRRVALTFDDGPSVKYTTKILEILNHFGVHATFFEEGKHVQGREDLMTAILASGDEIGNHSYHHPEYPGYGELSATSRRIKKATGFEPCLFRPPYGLTNNSVISAAGRLGMEVVEWDVDSLDDKHPGASAIRSNVLSQVQPGSIILMHDGGHHPQTVHALPGIIRGLEHDGFDFATVTQLTGGHLTYK